MSDCKHNPDFTCVVWYGQQYRFTYKQAVIVRILWRAWDSGWPVMNQRSVLAEAADMCIEFEGDSVRLVDVFRYRKKKHPAVANGMVVFDGQGNIELGSPPKKLSTFLKGATKVRRKCDEGATRVSQNA
ncbi:hypothetical protein ACYFX5_03665 [Bremerella sp. T1]|uniref:hypothetical protein n=1 Tax=Bremerella sp. TYQ1 TaxID=3119568 RepID=UPI001CCA067F|nr:hypothetical protein [Bremerella volcania]UBM37369.1 hypothetical protein LA756_05620 [Bremerella volcania]